MIWVMNLIIEVELLRLNAKLFGMMLERLLTISEAKPAQGFAVLRHQLF